MYSYTITASDSVDIFIFDLLEKYNGKNGVSKQHWSRLIIISFSFSSGFLKFLINESCNKPSIHNVLLLLKESRKRVKQEKKEPLVESQLFIMELGRELNRICQVIFSLPPP